AIPVPIPNTEVKLSSAEDTERAAFRENRSSPGSCAFRRISPRPSRSGLSSRVSGRPARSRAAILPSMTAADAGAQLVVLPPRPAGCPFLLAEAGGWRLDVPSRDHRCAAFSPPAPLAPEKQARLCLTEGHAACATYLASVAAREARLGAAPLDRTTRWGLARTTAVIQDPGGFRVRFLGAILDRRRRPAIPAALLLIALFALAVTGLRGLLPTTGAAASPILPAVAV